MHGWVLFARLSIVSLIVAMDRSDLAPPIKKEPLAIPVCFSSIRNAASSMDHPAQRNDEPAADDHKKKVKDRLKGDGGRRRIRTRMRTRMRRRKRRRRRRRRKKRNMIRMRMTMRMRRRRRRKDEDENNEDDDEEDKQEAEEEAE